MDLIQLFLLVNGLLVGVALTLALQHFVAHRSAKFEPKTGTQTVPTAVRERITKQAEQNFQGIVNRSALQLQRDLSSTTTELNKLLEKFGSEVLDEEIKLFREDVSAIRASTQSTLSGAQDEITTQQAALLKSLASRQKELDDIMVVKQKELEANLESSYSEQQSRLVEQLDTKLDDAMMAFLLETLGHDVDLGAQTDYLIRTLNDNKDDLKKEIRS